MNEDIRRIVRAELERRGLSVAEVARRIGKTRPQVSRMLSDTNPDSGRGLVPASWQKLLDELGYELVIQKKGGRFTAPPADPEQKQESSPRTT